MIKVNQSVVLGLNAVALLKNEIKPLRAEDMAKTMGVSYNFLQQVLLKLRKAGIICSIKGPGGGFFMVSKYPPLTALKVANAVCGHFVVTNFDESISGKLNKALIETYANFQV